MTLESPSVLIRQLKYELGALSDSCVNIWYCAMGVRKSLSFVESKSDFHGHLVSSVLVPFYRPLQRCLYLLPFPRYCQ